MVGVQPETGDSMSDNTHLVLPVHPVTGLRALGFTKRGPVWPVLGGSGEGEGGGEGGGETPPEGQQQPVQLPDDHPLVKTLAEQKSTIKDLKAKAKRLDDLEAASMSEADKAADRIAKAEAEAASVPAKVSEALRTHLVELHEIDKDDAELFLTATDPELMLKQVSRLLAQSGGKKKNHVSREGTNHKPADSEESAFVREFFGG
ncbi:scaffolding protein [Gordonia phage PhorbesPhlower]|nr:scaffolding protein [Gordonia phage PhorbesPhlower]UUG69866.1 scaffolding protein [Gordonia phage Morkie]